MALIGALLLSVVLSTALGGMAMIAAIERRAAAGYRTSLQLRAAAEGAAILAMQELGAAADWSPPLAGSGSAYWTNPPPGLDIAALTARLRSETMMGSAHGADTPVWQVFVQAGWRQVTGASGTTAVVAWIADDWTETDGNPAADTNGRILIRSVAVSGVATAWFEAVCERVPDDPIRMRHIRIW